MIAAYNHAGASAAREWAGCKLCWQRPLTPAWALQTRHGAQGIRDEQPIAKNGRRRDNAAGKLCLSLVAPSSSFGPMDECDVASAVREGEVIVAQGNNVSRLRFVNS